MTEEVTACGGMAILAMSGHGQDARATSSQHGQDARATSRETVGCELAAEVLRSFGKLRLRANGSSMLPAVWPGDILYIQGQDAPAALPGDIVLFGREGRLVAHRVVEVRTQEPGEKRRSRKSQIQNSKLQISDRKSPITNRESRTPNSEPLIPALSRIEFVTHGDSLDRDDPPVSSHELLGRVTAIERGSRRLNPRLTFWSSIASSILRRSDFLTRILLGVRNALPWKPTAQCSFQSTKG
jgi:hypothetical protein